MGKTSERIRARLRPNRPMTMISIRLPEDLLEVLKEMAPELGYSGYQPMIRAFIGQGIREYEAKQLEKEAQEAKNLKRVS